MGTIKPVMVAAAVALAGCASPPLSAGGKYEIQFAAGDIIRIAWNPQLTDEQAVRSVARAHCSGREVDEGPTPAGTAAAGTVTKTWRCKIFPGTGAR